MTNSLDAVHSKGVRVEAIGLGLRGVGYRPRGSQRIGMVVLAGSSSGLPDQTARPLHVGGRPVTQHIGVNRVILQREGKGIASLHFLGALAQPVVGVGLRQRPAYRDRL